MKMIISTMLIACLTLNNVAVARPHGSTAAAAIIGATIGVIAGSAIANSSTAPDVVVVRQQPEVVYVQPEPQVVYTQPEVIYVQPEPRVIYVPEYRYVRPIYQYTYQHTYYPRHEYRHNYRHLEPPPPPNAGGSPASHNHYRSNNGLRRR